LSSTLNKSKYLRYCSLAAQSLCEILPPFCMSMCLRVCDAQDQIGLM
jgi:hypothetical protein